MKKIIYIFVFILISLFQSCFFGAGSYSNAERSIFEYISNMELIEAIIKFKDKNPEYKHYNINEDGSLYESNEYIINLIGKPLRIIDQRNDSATFYTCSFHIPSENLNFGCKINVSILADSIPAHILLNSVSKGKGNTWKSINTNDLTKEENAKIKILFET